jgi:hypothetical protein
LLKRGAKTPGFTNGDAEDGSAVRPQALRPIRSVLPRVDGLPREVRDGEQTAGPAAIDACGAVARTKPPTNVSAGHSRLPSVWFAVFDPGIPRLQPWGTVKRR